MRARFGWLALLVLVACARRGTIAPNDAVNRAGVLRTISGPPNGQLTVVPRDSLTPPTALVGGDTIALKNAVGLEVLVFGRLTSSAPVSAPKSRSALIVERFVVTSADGHRAIDGIVNVTAGRPELVLFDGSRVAVPHMPPQLSSLVGARVFLAGPLSAPPFAYGVLRAP